MTFVCRDVFPDYVMYPESGLGNALMLWLRGGLM